MGNCIIDIKNATITQQGIDILKNINLKIEKGAFVYIIGKVGSGKSSFLKTLYADLPLKQGYIKINGFNLKNIKKSEIPLLRRKCGIVFQDFKLLTDRNVYSNLEFVLKATGWRNKLRCEKQILHVLERVDMKQKAAKMPYQLSGGEQQRIVLARALLNMPPIILADEPTGNLDPDASRRLISLLKEINNEGTTVIIATHQYDLIKQFPGKILKCSDCAITDANGFLGENNESTDNSLSAEIQ